MRGGHPHRRCTTGQRVARRHHGGTLAKQHVSNLKASLRSSRDSPGPTLSVVEMRQLTTLRKG
jgi:hypothetical protein